MYYRLNFISNFMCEHIILYKKHYGEMLLALLFYIENICFPQFKFGVVKDL